MRVLVLLLLLAQRWLSPAEVLATVDVHPGMRQFVPGLGTCAQTAAASGAQEADCEAAPSARVASITRRLASAGGLPTDDDDDDASVSLSRSGLR